MGEADGFNMEIKYDPDVDALYIEVRKGEFDHNEKLDKYTLVNYESLQ